MPHTDGPFLAMAVLCERTLEDREGVLSIIRVIDRITATIVAPDPPAAMPPTPVALTMVIMLRPGSARGRFTLSIRPESPSGRHLTKMDYPVHLDGEDRGINIVGPFQFVAEEEGLYWIDVLFEEERITRIPLRVMYEPQRVAAS